MSRPPSVWSGGGVRTTTAGTSTESASMCHDEDSAHSTPPARAYSYRPGASDAAASSTRIGSVRSSVHLSASSVRSTVSAGSAPLPTPVPADAHAARNLAQAWCASSQQGNQYDNSRPPSVVRTPGHSRPPSSVGSWVHVPSQFESPLSPPPLPPLTHPF